MPVVPGYRATRAGSLAGDPRVVHRIDLPARPGVTADWPDWINPDLRRAYEARGIARPWLHQVRTAQLAWDGHHVMVATGTASGKSAAFGIPALTAVLEPPPARATGRGATVLYVSPTKALAHDQLAGVEAMGLAGLRAAALDGDTPDEQRRWARSHARWLVTNPDMLHRGLLPAHERWRGFLRGLRFIVVDEAHVYRGMFGSHVALVLRRLRRAATVHGADPTFVLASATIADPGQAAARLLGVEVAVVGDDASTRGPLQLLLWNPLAGVPAADPPAQSAGGAVDVDVAPEHAEHDASRPSTLAQVAEITARLVDEGTSTLAFVRSRRGVEVVAGLVRARAVHGERVRAYRGGYLPEERRALEADLRSGRLLGLAATNALELGIDISGLDAVVLAGWPGTQSSLWQQVGRAGRRATAALAVLVAREDPLDQYLMRHPEVLTGRPVEATVLDPDNPYVLAGHLCAAAAEAPLIEGCLIPWFGPGAPDMCDVLAARGLLRRRRDGWYWTSTSRPADLVDLRGASGGPVRVVEDRTGSLLGTVDPATAPAVVHKGAVYVHQGATFQILDLDLEARVATAAATTTDLTTHARSQSDVAFEQVKRVVAWGPVEMYLGEVRLTHQVTSYLVRRWPTGQVIGEHPLDLPPMPLHTTAVWWSIPDDVLARAAVDEADIPGAVHALEHAAIGILPLLASCDRWDIGGMSTNRHPQTGQAAIVVHDGHPGGAGFAERGFHRADEWFAATLEAISTCGCSSGCPSCVQSPKCGNGNLPLHKAAALRLARAMRA